MIWNRSNNPLDIRILIANNHTFIKSVGTLDWPFNPKILQASNIALLILCNYFGHDWVGRRILRPIKKIDKFFKVDPPITGEKMFYYYFRIIDFAEKLYNLQYVKGIDGRMDAIKTDNLASASSELFVARGLYTGEVPFEFIRPKGIMGDDYDLALTLENGLRVCADAKQKLYSRALQPNTISSLLKQARGQMPKKAPKGVFIDVPQHWIEDAHIRDRIESDIESFFIRNPSFCSRNKEYSPIPTYYIYRKGYLE